MNHNLHATLLRHLLSFTLAALPLWSHAIEEPDYAVIRKLDNEQRLSDAAPDLEARRGGAWRRINLVELNRRYGG